MIVGIVMGVISALISLLSQKCFKVGNMEDSTRAKMTLTAGIMFMVGGEYNYLSMCSPALGVCKMIGGYTSAKLLDIYDYYIIII